MDEPIEKRLERLQELVSNSELISVVQSHQDSNSLFEAVKQLELEGIVSKKKGSSYQLDYRSLN